MSFLKADARPIFHNTVGSTLSTLLILAGAAVISFFTARSYDLPQQPLYKAAFVGALLFIVIAFGVLLIGVAVNLMRRRGHTGTSVPESDITHDTKCPDAWLHEIARDQAATIFRFVRITRCVIAKNELFGRREPYMEIQLAIDNRSVYDVCLDDPTGAIFFDGRELTGALTCVDGSPPTHGNEGVVTLKQKLDNHDVVHVLNSSPELTFDFSRLHLRAKGAPTFDAVVPQPLNLSHRVTNAVLLEKYPKLDIQVGDGLLASFIVNLHDWSKNEDSYVTMPITIRSARTFPVVVESAELTVTTKDKQITAIAEKGETHEKLYIDEQNRFRRRDRQLNNLADELPMRIQQAEVSGDLQFVFRGSGLLFINRSNVQYQLILTDSNGEIHPCLGIINKVGED